MTVHPGGRQRSEPQVSVPGLADPRPLGRGGFGTVYRAWQVGLGREVALKVDSRVLVDERDRRRFVREASAAGQLSGHAHIVGVYDAGVTADGRPYLVMELCPGGSLAELVLEHGPLPAAQVRRIGIGIADALATAHAAGILHRDVKPGNILLDRYGVAKLADFGLAALLDASGESSATREALTPAYAPPEAFAFVRPAPVGDVYALAATLYAILAGRPPRSPSWPPRSFAELSAGLRAPVRPVPGVGVELNAVLAQALEADPDARTPTAADFRAALQAVPEPPGPAAPGGGSPGGSLPGAVSPAGLSPAWPPPAGVSPGGVSPGGVAPSWPPAGGSSGGMSSAGRSPSWPSPGGVSPGGVGSGGVGSGGVAPSWPPLDGVSPSPPPVGGGRHRSPDATPGRRAATGPARWWVVVAAVAAVAVVVLAVTLYLTRPDGQPAAAGGRSGAPPSGAPPSGVGPSGAGQTGAGQAGTADLPAGLVACADLGAGALCPTEPTCWEGLVENGGHKVDVRTIDCAQPHHWEAFAAGRLRADPAVATAAEIDARPEVTAVCRAAVLTARARPGVDTTGWRTDTEPHQFLGRGWFFYCVASPSTGAEPTGAAFVTGAG
jgi:serine/threonine protein kinase